MWLNIKIVYIDSEIDSSKKKARHITLDSKKNQKKDLDASAKRRMFFITSELFFLLHSLIQVDVPLVKIQWLIVRVVSFSPFLFLLFFFHHTYIAVSIPQQSSSSSFKNTLMLSPPTPNHPYNYTYPPQNTYNILYMYLFFFCLLFSIYYYFYFLFSTSGAHSSWDIYTIISSIHVHHYHHQHDFRLLSLNAIHFALLVPCQTTPIFNV